MFTGSIYAIRGTLPPIPSLTVLFLLSSWIMYNCNFSSPLFSVSVCVVCFPHGVQLDFEELCLSLGLHAGCVPVCNLSYSAFRQLLLQNIYKQSGNQTQLILESVRDIYNNTNYVTNKETHPRKCQVYSQQYMMYTNKWQPNAVYLNTCYFVYLKYSIIRQTCHSFLTRHICYINIYQIIIYLFNFIFVYQQTISLYVRFKA